MITARSILHNRLALILGISLAACGDDGGSNLPDAARADAATASDAAPADAGPATEDVLALAVQAIGGEEALTGMARIEITATGQRFEHAENYTPDEPTALRGDLNLTASIDLEGNRSRFEWERNTRLFGTVFSLSYAEVIDNGRGMATPCDHVFGFCTTELTSQRIAAVTKQERLKNPHIVLRAALGSPQLVSLGEPQEIGGALHHTLVVADELEPFELSVHSETGEIARASTLESDHTFGDVEIAVVFSDWGPVSGSELRFPASLELSMAGIVLHTESDRSASFNPEFDPELFAEAASATQELNPAEYEWGLQHSEWLNRWLGVGLPLDNPFEFVTMTEMVPDSGVYFLSGAAHNSLVVELDVGLVVVEAPCHERRSQALLAKIREQWPDTPITHVVATHFHDDHSAGVRTFVAEGATLVVGEASEGFFNRMLAAPHTLVPDALERATGVTPEIETVASGAYFEIGTPERGVQVWPVASTHSYDMVIAYVPQAGIVFNSDLYNPIPPALGQPLTDDRLTTAIELRDAIEAANLDVNIMAGGHNTSVTYDQFVQHIAISPPTN